MINISQKAVLPGHQHPIYTLEISQKPTIFFSAGGEASVVEWSLKKMQHIKIMFKTLGSIYALHAPKSFNTLIAADRKGLITIFDFVTNKIHNTDQIHHKPVFDIKSCNNYFFSSSEDGTICKWSLKTLECVRQVKISDQTIRSVSIHPTKNIIAAAGKDNFIYLLEKETLQVIQILEGHTLPVFSITFSPNGKYLLSGGRDAQLKIWDVEKAFTLKENIPAHLFAINHILFLGNSDFFASASMDKSIKIWNINDFQLYQIIDQAKMNGHTLSVNKLAWDDSSKTLISASDDKMIMLWNVDFL